MQEFSSISVSSYEAGVLADRLTEKSVEGWEVVSIVPTGSTVTAYLSRPSGTGEAADTSAGEIAAVAAVVAEPADAEPEVDVGEDADTEAEADAETMIEETVPETATSADDAGWTALAAEVANDAGEAEQEVTPSDPEPATTAADAAPEPEPAPEATAAAEIAGAAAGAAAPAGWYADPSSRFELRYWDGAQWTEHVSRAGQQYTDPPVA